MIENFNTKTHFAIAIDGPSGSGKSTIAKMIAQKLQCIYVDTGAMYRAIGLYLLRHHISMEEEEEIQKHLSNISIYLEHLNGIQKIYLNQEEVSEWIRTQEVGACASRIARYLSVREKLVNLQREIAKRHNVVMDGRDIGSVVLPNASIKIFLTANVEVRAKRRYDELQAKGESCTFAEIIKEIEARDYQDSHREYAPLIQVQDAIQIDSSYLSISQVVEKILEIVEKRLQT